jgi:trehalose-phosphatase
VKGRWRGRLPRGFWRAVVSARHRLLLLDYDGTLAPFRLRRDGAVPFPGARAILERVAAAPATSVAVVSGRRLEPLARLLRTSGVELVGEHGWEVRRRDGRVSRKEVPKRRREALEEAMASAREAGFGARLERKRASVVLHTRGLPPARARALQRACASLWGGGSDGGLLRLVPIDGGIELRAPGRDKGTAVRDLLEACPTGTLPVFLGDDATDEDAFRAVRARGFGIRVGPSARRSFASGRIRSCAGVRAFLARWLEEVASSEEGGDR